MSKQKTSILILFLVIITVGFVMINKMFKNTLTDKFDNAIPKKFAVQKAKNNQELISIIGDSIKVIEKNNQNKKKGKFSFSLNSDGFDMNQKNINLKINIRGTKGEAYLKVLAEKEETSWVYEEISVITTSESKKINLLKN